MKSDIKIKYIKELTFDLPILYKEMLLYPVRMKDIYDFRIFVQSIILEKNSVPSVEFISMPYLDFMYKISSKDTPYVGMFRELLSIVLNKKREDIVLGYNDKNKATFSIKYDDKLYEYNSQDFEEIKQIICEQNLVDIPDETIQKEIRDRIQEAKKVRDKANNVKHASLEDLVVAIIISTSLKEEEVMNLSIRKFHKIIEREDNKLHYKIYLNASLSGLVEFKNKNLIKHWLSDLTTNEMDEFTIGLDEMKSRLNL